MFSFERQNDKLFCVLSLEIMLHGEQPSLALFFHKNAQWQHVVLVDLAALWL